MSEDVSSVIYPEIRPALQRLLIPGTDADIVRRYATLAERAKDAAFGAFEDEVIILDVETTGLSYTRDRIIEVGAVRLNANTITDRFSTFVDPQMPIPEQITELTSIRDSDVAGAPDIETVLRQLAAFVGGTAIVAHNSGFDQTMLRNAGSRRWSFIDDQSWIDSIELARISLPRCRSHGLQALSGAFCDQRSTHRAIDDATSLAQLWRIMLTALGDFPPGLVARIATLFPATKWPLRPFISQVAGSLPNQEQNFSLSRARRQRVSQSAGREKQDAWELMGGRSELRPVGQDEIVEAFTEQGLLGKMYTAYETRSEQTEMALAVAEALNSNTHLAVEAGTGVGKSMAYLLPLALFAQRNQICVAVATKTNTLLDQLLFSELPRLSAALPHGLVFSALKGFDHYPCLRKLDSLSRQNDRLTGASDSNGITVTATLLSYVCQSLHGDLDHLRLLFDEISRFEVVASSEDCLRRRCRFYSDCLLHGARRAAAHSDIVVTNQALLFCDMNTEGSILPSIRHWVIDEAHGVEDEARSQLSEQVNCQELAAVLEALTGSRGALHTMLEKIGSINDVEGAAQTIDTTDISTRIVTALAQSQAAPAILESLASELKGLVSLAEKSSYDQLEVWINARVRDSGEWSAMFTAGSALSRRLTQLWQDSKSIVSLANQYDGLDENAADLAGLAADLGLMLEALNLILNGDDPAYVYSASLDRRPEVKSDSLLAARIDIGEVLAEELYPNTMSVIFTSATLATGTSFEYFARASGLSSLPADSWQTLQLSSSFDFDRQMAIYLPRDIPEPNQDGYHEALEELLYQVHTAMGGSVLTLFTNRREMEYLYQRLKDRLESAGIALRCQWRGSGNRRLSEEFLANRELSLFALRSFWQGFDAPGDTLRCVVIPRLPFNRPTDPLNCERALRERDSWRRYVLPEAIIEMRQAAGRLIRSASDSGALVLADSRLLSKSYGKDFIAAMPSRQVYTLNTASIGEALATDPAATPAIRQPKATWNT